MKSCIIIALTLVALISCSGEQPKSPQLLEYINEKKLEKDTLIYDSIANYTIIFPIRNIEEKSAANIIDGKEVEIHYRHANLLGEKHNIAYSILYKSIPQPLEENDKKSYYDSLRDEVILESNNCIIEKDTTIDIDGVSGRHLLLSLTDQSNLTITCRFVSKDNNTYILTVATEKDNLFNNNISKFLDSFQFIK